MATKKVYLGDSNIELATVEGVTQAIKDALPAWLGSIEGTSEGVTKIPFMADRTGDGDYVSVGSIGGGKIGSIATLLLLQGPAGNDQQLAMLSDGGVWLRTDSETGSLQLGAGSVTCNGEEVLTTVDIPWAPAVTGTSDGITNIRMGTSSMNFADVGFGDAELSINAYTNQLTLNSTGQISLTRHWADNYRNLQLGDSDIYLRTGTSQIRLSDSDIDMYLAASSEPSQVLLNYNGIDISTKRGMSLQSSGSMSLWSSAGSVMLASHGSSLNDTYQYISIHDDTVNISSSKLHIEDGFGSSRCIDIYYPDGNQVVLDSDTSQLVLCSSGAIALRADALNAEVIGALNLYSSGTLTLDSYGSTQLQLNGSAKACYHGVEIATTNDLPSIPEWVSTVEGSAAGITSIKGADSGLTISSGTAQVALTTGVDIKGRTVGLESSDGDTITLQNNVRISSHGDLTLTAQGTLTAMARDSVNIGKKENSEVLNKIDFNNNGVSVNSNKQVNVFSSGTLKLESGANGVKLNAPSGTVSIYGSGGLTLNADASTLTLSAGIINATASAVGGLAATGKINLSAVNGIYADTNIYVPADPAL